MFGVLILSPTNKGRGLHGLCLKLHLVHLAVKFSEAELARRGELDYQVHQVQF